MFCNLFNKYKLIGCYMSNQFGQSEILSMFVDINYNKDDV